MTERERSKKKLETFRDGGGSGGGIRTAVDTQPSGSGGFDSSVLKPTAAFLGSDVLLRFTLSVLLTPFVEVLFDGSDATSVSRIISTYSLRLLVVEVGDNSDMASEVCALINSKEARGTRFIVLSSHHVATQFYRRLSNAGVSALCLIQSGPETVRDALHAVVAGNKYFDQSLDHLITQRLYALSPSGNLTLDDSDILLRLKFTDALLCSELGLDLNKINEVLSSLFAKIEVSSRDEAIGKIEEAGFSMLNDKGSSERNNNLTDERKSCATKCERVIARWLQEQLMGSRS